MGKVKKAFGAFLVPLLSVLLAFLIGGIIMAALGANPFLAVKFLFQGAFGSKAGIGTTLTKATPLIFTALCACFAYKCGVFNLGGEGQFLMGSIVCCYIATQSGIEGLPAILLCLVGGAASALAATGLGLFVGTLPVKGGKASKSGILTGFATTCALFAGLYGEPAMALADDVARACPAECWLNPVKLICDMFNRLYFFEDLGPFAVRAGALVLMALLFVAAATLIFGRSRYEHL